MSSLDDFDRVPLELGPDAISAVKAALYRLREIPVFAAMLEGLEPAELDFASDQGREDLDALLWALFGAFAAGANCGVHAQAAQMQDDLVELRANLARLELESRRR